MAKNLKINRKELKQADRFISITDVALAYCSKNKVGIISLLSVIILVAFSGFWFSYNQKMKSLTMESLYFEIEQIKNANETSSNNIVEKIKNILIKFDEGPQKQRALMILADQYYKTHSYDLAISVYQSILNKTVPSNLQYQLANTGIAYSLEGKKDYKTAIVTYKTIIESHDAYPLFYIYLSLARCYELNENYNGALLTLREMKTKFLNHPKFDLVDSRLNKLESLV